MCSSDLANNTYYPGPPVGWQPKLHSAWAWHEAKSGEIDNLRRVIKELKPLLYFVDLENPRAKNDGARAPWHDWAVEAAAVCWENRVLPVWQGKTRWTYSGLDMSFLKGYFALSLQCYGTDAKSEIKKLQLCDKLAAQYGVHSLPTIGSGRDSWNMQKMKQEVWGSHAGRLKHFKNSPAEGCCIYTAGSVHTIRDPKSKGRALVVANAWDTPGTQNPSIQQQMQDLRALRKG